MSARERQLEEDVVPRRETGTKGNVEAAPQNPISEFHLNRRHGEEKSNTHLYRGCYNGWIHRKYTLE